MKKLIFYYTHKESLGHTIRSLSIINALNRNYGKNLKTYVFQAGKPQDYLLIPKGTQVFHVPSPYYSSANFKRHPQALSLPLNSRARSEYMLRLIIKINPDIFITEFFPFGRHESRFELLPVLAYLKRKKIRICASIGYPYITLDNYKIIPSYLNFYDELLIHVPKDTESKYFLRNIQKSLFKDFYRNLFFTLRKRIRYTGYILPYTVDGLKPIDEIREEFNALGKIMVLVSRGGGVIHPKIITHSILAKKYLSDKFVFVVVAGPATSEAGMSLFRELMGKIGSNNIFLVKYSQQFSSFMRACDISISMSGYNTSVQLLYFKKKSIIIPSSVNSETAKGYGSEQLARSELLQDYLNAKVMNYNDLSAKEIARNIKYLSKPNLPRPFIKPDWFGGARYAARYLMEGK